MSGIQEEIKKQLAEEPKASDLRDILQENNELEEKTLFLKLIPGQRPEVVFTGTWSGKFIKAAMNSSSKAYRVRRYKPRRPISSKEARVQNIITGGK